MADWFTENAPPTPDEAQMLAQIRAREAGGDYSARNPKPGSTASGAYQFTSSTVSPTWQLATKATGVPAYPSAAEAPPAIQDANALYMLRKHGPNATITWAASGPYKQPRNQGGANRAQDDGQAASSDVLSRLATGDVSPDELAQYLQPAPQAPSAASTVQAPAPAGPVQPGDWFAKNAPPPKPPTPPPPSALDEAKRLGSIVAGSSGVTAVKDILAGGTKAAMDFLTGNPVNPQDVRQFKSAAGGILGGISGEPERMRQQLIKSGDAMLHGDINSAADHLWFSLPFAGAAGERMAERLKSGDIKGAFADAVGSLLPFAAEPAISGTKAAIEAAPEAAATAATAAKGAAIGAGKAAIETVPLKRLGVEIQIPKPLATGAATSAGLGFAGVPHPVGFAIGAASPIIKGAFTGAREALAERMAANLPVPPEVGITPEVLPPLQLGPGPIITPPPPDPSFVRAVPAEYPYVEHPLVRAARQAGDFTPQEQALADHILQNVGPTKPPATPPVAPAAPQAAPAAPEASAATQEPSAAPVVPEAPQTLQPASAVEKLTDYVLGKKIAPHMIDRLPPEYWQMIADDAGTAVPTADEIAQIKANVAAKAVSTPVQGEQVFETQKARIEEGMTPPKETPQEPPNYPPHYEYIRQADSKMAAERAFLKDQRVADYLLGKGITPEEFLAKTLEEQNKLILEAPAKSAKGKHLPFLPKPEGAAPRAVGRYAEEGTRDIADTMRWRQAQTPAAPEPAAIPTEGLENTPIAGKAGFEAEKAKPAPAKRTRRARPRGEL